MFLVNLAHQFIWLSLVFTRNVSFKYSQIWLYLKLAFSVKSKVKLDLNEVDYDHIFIMSDRAEAHIEQNPIKHLRLSFIIGKIGS